MSISEVRTCIHILLMPYFEFCEFNSKLLKLLRGLLNKFLASIVLTYQCISLRKKMGEATTCREYEVLGHILDILKGKEKWKNQKESNLYDWERIEMKLLNMRTLREAKDIQGLVHCLRQDL